MEIGENNRNESQSQMQVPWVPSTPVTPILPKPVPNCTPCFEFSTGAEKNIVSDNNAKTCVETSSDSVCNLGNVSFEELLAMADAAWAQSNAMHLGDDEGLKNPSIPAQPTQLSLEQPSIIHEYSQDPQGISYIASSSNRTSLVAPPTPYSAHRAESTCRELYEPVVLVEKTQVGLAYDVNTSMKQALNNYRCQKEKMKYVKSKSPSASLSRGNPPRAKSKENPTGKMKSVKRKRLNETYTPPTEATGELTKQMMLKSAKMPCRRSSNCDKGARYENSVCRENSTVHLPEEMGVVVAETPDGLAFDLDTSMKQALNNMSLLEDMQVPGSSLSKSNLPSAKPKENPICRRKHVRRKRLNKIPTPPTEVAEESIKLMMPETSKMSCRRSLNFDIGARDERSAWREKSIAHLGKQIDVVEQMHEGLAYALNTFMKQHRHKNSVKVVLKSVLQSNPNDFNSSNCHVSMIGLQMVGSKRKDSSTIKPADASSVDLIGTQYNELLPYKTQCRVQKKKRSEKGEISTMKDVRPALDVAREVIWKNTHTVDALAEQFIRQLDGNTEARDLGFHEQNALVPHKQQTLKQNSLVHGDGTIVPFQGSIDPIRKQHRQPQVDFDEEANRVRKLLMLGINSHGFFAMGEEKDKWCVFRGCRDSFIAQMHLLQEDRLFFQWKASLVGSVIGVFLTQNISDRPFRSEFMSVATQFPHKSSSKCLTYHGVGTSLVVNKPQVHIVELEPEENTKCDEKILNHSVYDQSSMNIDIIENSEGEEAVDSNDSYRTTRSIISLTDESSCRLLESAPRNIREHHDPMKSGPISTMTEEGQEKSCYGSAGKVLNDIASSRCFVILSQISGDFSSDQIPKKIGSCLEMYSIVDSEVEDMSSAAMYNLFCNNTSFSKLLEMANSGTLHEVNSQRSKATENLRGTYGQSIGMKHDNPRENLRKSDVIQSSLEASIIPSHEHNFKLNPNSGVLECQCFDPFNTEASSSCLLKNKDENDVNRPSLQTRESASQAAITRSQSDSEPLSLAQGQVAADTAAFSTNELDQLVATEHLDADLVPLLGAFFVKYPTMRLTRMQPPRVRGFAYTCLCNLLAFLKCHNTSDCLESKRTEFIVHLQEISCFPFDKEWLRFVEERILLPDSSSKDCGNHQTIKQDTAQELAALSMEIDQSTRRLEQLHERKSFLTALLNDLVHKETLAQNALDTLLHF